MLEEITIPLPDGGARPGVLALPSLDSSPRAGVPGVVVIHDVTGFQPDTRRHCRRFAEAGYAAIAPDLYAGQIGCVVRTVLGALRDGGEALGVIEASRELLAARPEVDEARIGITGFCMGGGFALLAAADGHYGVAAPFYGKVPKSKERLSGLCPTLAQFGERDAVFRGQGVRLRQHLEDLEIPGEVLIYPGVGHSFMNEHVSRSRLGPLDPMRMAYDPATEAVAWEKLLAFFETHMPPASPSA